MLSLYVPEVECPLLSTRSGLLRHPQRTLWSTECGVSGRKKKMQKARESVLWKACVLGSCAPTWRHDDDVCVWGGGTWSNVTVRCVSSSVNMSRGESEGRNKRRSPGRRDIKTRRWPRNGACVSCVRKQQQQQWALWHMAQAAVRVGDGSHMRCDCIDFIFIRPAWFLFLELM